MKLYEKYKGLHRRQKLTIQFAFLGFIGIILISVGLYFYFTSLKLTEYTNSAYKFKLKYPEGWEVRENYEGVAVAFISPQEGGLDLFRENITIVVQNIGTRSSKSLKAYTEDAVKQILAVFESNIQVVESSPSTFSGKAAHRFNYTGSEGNKEGLQFLHVWTVEGNIAYQMNITGQKKIFDKNKRLFNTVIRSFRIL